MNDTICAISTSLGVGAISIVRVSGDDAISIVNKIFSKDLSKIDSHTINYGFILENGIKIDEVLVSVMKHPKSYTGEDIIEINCHGGISATKKVLSLLLDNGCRLAEAGEFTKRAFLNNKIDLLKAEAIGDMINAETDKARIMAMNQVDGKLTSLIENIRSEIVGLLSNLEVNIDFPEYDDIEVVTKEIILPKLNDYEKKTKEILDTFNSGKIIKDGIEVVIIGKPNVGKSSLLNALLKEDKAIVTDIAGTTRDILEGKVIINGIVLNLIDTAGIRETNDLVESIGVEKSKKAIEKADLVIQVINNNEELTKEDKELLEEIKIKTHIVFINKSDLTSKIDLSSVNTENTVIGNTVEKTGLDGLIKKIVELFDINSFDSKDLTYISNVRQYDLVKQANSHINSCIMQIDGNMPVDIIAYDLKESFDLLGQVIGTDYEDELLDEMFKRFCLGK